MTPSTPVEYALYPSRRKALTLFFGCAFFVVPPLLMSLKRALSWPLWLGVGFFGFGMLLGLRGLLDRKPRIVLDEDGVLDRTLRRGRIPWETIRDAYPVNVAGQHFIALVLDLDFVAGLGLPLWVSRANDAVGAESLNLNLSQIKVDADRLCMAIKLLAHLPREERALPLTMLKEKGHALLSGR